MPIRNPAPFFDSVAGDRVYSSADFRRVLSRTAKDGYVKADGEELEVFARTPAEMAVEVGLGSAFVRGGWLEVYSDREVRSVNVADPLNPRIDRVVVRLDTSERSIGVQIKRGIPAVSPLPPSLERTASVWELSLASLRVAAGASQITSSDITDERNDPTVCGVAASPSGIENVGGVVAIQANALAMRPSASGLAGRFFIETDGLRKLYRSDGTAWEELALARVSARLHRSTNQTLNASATTVISFDHARWNVGDLFSPANPTRLVAPENGRYLITAHARVSGSFNHSYIIRVNGTSIIARLQQSGQTVSSGQALSTQWQMEAGDYAEFLVANSSTTNENVISEEAFSPDFMMTRIG